MGNEKTVQTWEQFLHEIQRLEELHSESYTPLLFRGQANATWLLASTLARRAPNVRFLMDYYRVLLRLKPAVETLAKLNLDLPDYDQLKSVAESYDSHRGDGKLTGYSYMAHVRHLGFPSPLLDWTRSCYVAAYFAFAEPQAENVAIYAYCEWPNNMKHSSSDQPQIHRLGPYTKTHERHFRQQCEYTTCQKFEAKGGWSFSSYQDFLDLKFDSQDLIYKYIITASERMKVLRYLDKLNLNAYSLFASDESLMEMLAFREIDLRYPNKVVS